eukprot:NODE_5832_length_551_cov_304.695565.p1 GENE.NODE_5832_length_551_cov_304.695565~~NODE_5832_length_551_cov_304.695565.p1  ORF type:complete len:155 (+),score=29.24 NODE_5832_length_551_cov_304.695565:71-466(+)
MLGGKCHTREFFNVHPGPNSTSNGYDVKGLLGDWTDVIDGLLFKEASFAFWSNAWEYGVSVENCVNVICASAADAFLNGTTPHEFEHEPLWTFAGGERESVDNVSDLQARDADSLALAEKLDASSEAALAW